MQRCLFHKEAQELADLRDLQCGVLSTKSKQLVNTPYHLSVCRAFAAAVDLGFGVVVLPVNAELGY